MKKIIISMMAAAALFTSCDPVKDDTKWAGTDVTAESLNEALSLKQYDLDEENNYVESPDGNYIKYSTSPSKPLRIFLVDAEGNEIDLTSGDRAASGIFPLLPGRGSNPVQTIHFSTLEMDGSSVEITRDVTVKVAQELEPGMGYLVSYAGKKIWKWDTSEGKEVWGNFGYTASDGETFADNFDGKWWGVANLDDFAGQQQHRGADAVKGDDKQDSYMVLGEDGSIKCYDPEGNEIRSAKFKLVNYNPAEKKVINDQPWSIGQFHVNGGGGVLWPYAINMDGYQPEDYEIVRLTNDQLILTYAKEGTGSWNEATYWRFRSTTDKQGLIAGYESKGTDWVWDTEIGAFWGNHGYHAGKAGADWATANAGQWWGVTSTADFAGQQQHRGADKVTGDDDTNAWMTIIPDGNIKSYNAAGVEIRSGKWSFNPATENEFKFGTLNTTAGSILWPYAINMDGFQPTEFELVYISEGKMALVYAKDGTGDWSEATFWRFKKK